MPNRRFREIQIRFKPRSRRTDADGRRESEEGASKEAENPSFCSFHHFHPRARVREGGTNQADKFPDEGEKQGDWELTRFGKKATISNRILIFFFETY